MTEECRSFITWVGHQLHLATRLSDKSVDHMQTFRLLVLATFLFISADVIFAQERRVTDAESAQIVKALTEFDNHPLSAKSPSAMFADNAVILAHLPDFEAKRWTKHCETPQDYISSHKTHAEDAMKDNASFEIKREIVEIYPDDHDKSVAVEVKVTEKMSAPQIGYTSSWKETIIFSRSDTGLKIVALTIEFPKA